ncbi:hypothetical protein [Luteibacter sp. CQ10]|uniref:hypothetical protein n=1 Tax=Luteibacter sp. CQ10 TaxID=2805821 RepID=UPI0034A1AB49
MPAHDYRSQEAALDKAIRLAQGGSRSSRSIELPCDGTVRSTIREILSLPEGAPVDATAEELRLFGKVHCLMSTHNPKWLSSSQATFPPEMRGGGAAEAQRLVSRLPNRATMDEPDGPMAAHNLLVKTVHDCIPRSDRDKYPWLLHLTNTSEVEWADGVTELVPAMGPAGWYALRVCQDDIYRTVNETQGVVVLKHWLYTRKYLAAVSATDRQRRIQASIAALPWRHLESHADERNGSLFSRLLLHIALNRFLWVELGIDLLTNESAGLQGDLLQVLAESGHASIGELIRQFQSPAGIDHLAMANHALRHVLTGSRRKLGVGLASTIDAQAEAIVASCRLHEFTGDTVNDNLADDLMATKTVAWLILAIAALREVTVLNQDPSVHSKRVRVMSQRTSLETHGVDMVRLRKAVSSLLVSGQAWRLSVARWKKQVQFAQSIRLLCRETLYDTFKPASIDVWQRIFAMCGIDQVLATHAASASVDSQFA